MNMEEDGYGGGWIWKRMEGRDMGKDTGNGYGNGGLEPRINPQHGERLLCKHIDDDDSGGYGFYIASLHTHTHGCF
jgi:hypothetical protein